MMNIKKSLLALAVPALALMGFASSAAGAVDGTVVDVNDEKPIPANRELHLIGWAEFQNNNGDGIVCHVTSVLKTTSDTTGEVTKFSIPNTTNCKGTNALAQCKLKSDEVTGLPYHATATPPSEATPAGQIDITGSIVIHNKLEGFLCPAEITLTFSEITLKPLKAGEVKATGTAGKLGTTAGANDSIAGVELHGFGESHSVLGTEKITATGELEVAEADRGTWKITTDAVVKDVINEESVPANRELHLLGWAEFQNKNGDGIVCHVTSVVKATPLNGKAGEPEGRTGDVTVFKIPDTTKCKGTKALAQCKLKSDEVTGLPYHVIVTPSAENTPAGDFDITGSIVIHNKLEGFLCPAEITLTFSSITAKPLEAGGGITGTTCRADPENTAEFGEPIAGVELSGTGESHSVLGTEVIQATGELEVAEADRCTWKIGF